MPSRCCRRVRRAAAARRRRQSDPLPRSPLWVTDRFKRRRKICRCFERVYSLCLTRLPLEEVFPNDKVYEDEGFTNGIQDEDHPTSRSVNYSLPVGVVLFCSFEVELEL